MRVTAARFGPRWLRAQLSRLVPKFPDVRVCVAFSGGVDSTALLAAFARIGSARLKLRALHVHHGLSAHADAWLPLMAGWSMSAGMCPAGSPREPA